jgi:hypothetical protein
LRPNFTPRPRAAFTPARVRSLIKLPPGGAISTFDAPDAATGEGQGTLARPSRSKRIPYTAIAMSAASRAFSERLAPPDKERMGSCIWSDSYRPWLPPFNPNFHFGLPNLIQYKPKRHPLVCEPHSSSRSRFRPCKTGLSPCAQNPKSRTRVFSAYSTSTHVLVCRSSLCHRPPSPHWSILRNGGFMAPIQSQSPPATVGKRCATTRG